MVECIQARSEHELEEVRKLFLEYGESLNFHLCFQSFAEEVRTLPGNYFRLILCLADGQPAGCAGLKPLRGDACEMKRLFVRPGFRGRRIGSLLVSRLIEEARSEGYKFMRLDTIPGAMDRAIALYRSFGFVDIPPYHDNPLPEAIYMEKQLVMQ